MKNKIIYMSVATALVLPLAANALWGSDITIKKERQPIAPEWVKKNDNQVTRSVFEIDKSALPAVNGYLEESQRLFKLKYIDFDTISTLNPAQVKLTYKGKEATQLRDQYVVLINSVKQVIAGKVAQRQQAILDSETVSKGYAMEIARLEANREGYRATVQAVYDLKDETIAAQKVSEQSVKDYSAQLVAVLNQHPALTKALKDKHFERPKIKSGQCSEPVISKKTSIQVGYSVQGFCFSSKFKVAKNSADSVTSDGRVMSALEGKLTAIAQEKIKQGETYKKTGGQPGYEQEIKAFSHGGINDVKIAAKEKYGSTEKGLSRKINNLNKKLASNNRQIATKKANVAVIPRKELMRSEELKALKPLSEQLDVSIIQYLDASLVHIMGEPIKQSTEDYQRIELDESTGILLVKDSYPSGTKDQVELYLINPTMLQESKAIKKHFDGKAIPTRAAASENALLLWGGEEASYARAAPSLKNFLSRL